jgi:hypothetical protein
MAEKSGDKTKSRTESIITPSSRPYGKHSFQKVLEMWELAASPDLKDWWQSHKGLSAPDGTPYVKDVQRWFDPGRKPKLSNANVQSTPSRLKPDDRALYCIKLSIWWHSGVHPWINQCEPWQLDMG